MILDVTVGFLKANFLFNVLIVGTIKKKLKRGEGGYIGTIPTAWRMESKRLNSMFWSLLSMSEIGTFHLSTLVW